ncbi:MAG: hypothetical protein HYX42_07540 [Polaromonas sp.]|uniref:hypothetical protein n=1 Tax=Polaromonas sp. TaxID=1869339 RepID=UPI0025E4DD63|nr:hypothetical protein [Polaromonas sp.]MBI2726087.1 hypothetical protein [Polaromonas sp.]
MKLKKFAVELLLVFELTAVNAVAQEWPKLLNPTLNQPECTTALHLAQSAHKSTAFNLWEPQPLPDDLEGTLVLGPQGVDLSGGDALDVNLEVFTKVPRPDYPARSIYWQKKSSHSNRLAIEEIPHGWRGDEYAVRLVPVTLTTDEYFSTTNRRAGSKLTTLIDGTWRAPLIFQNRTTNNLWLVYVGEPYMFSPDWVVYLPIDGQLQEVCKVQFRPDVRHAALLLPGSVQRLATLLDKSIGNGENEGTLRPTARLRINVSQAWANAALRPWAMGTPYNSREEVDMGLFAWAQRDKVSRKTYAEIQAQYKIAEKALQAYYRKQFNIPAAESQSTARSALDAAFRTHYVFPKPR